MQTYLIKVTHSESYYDENPDELKAISVPDNVKLEDILKELKIINYLFIALKELSNYESSDDCIESEILEEYVEDCKKMRDRIFSSEEDVNEVYYNEGCNASVLFSYLISIHDDWSGDNSIATAEFDMEV